MESLWLTPPQVDRLDRFHFLNMRSILGIKAPYISRISHAEVHKAALSHGLTAGSLSQVYISRRFKLLGHILRHPETLEHDVMFDHATRVRALDIQTTTMRAGHPRPHWPEMSIIHAADRLRVINNPHTCTPKIKDYMSPFYMQPEMTEVWNQLGGTIYSFNAHFGHHYGPVNIAAQDGLGWSSTVGR